MDWLGIPPAHQEGSVPFIRAVIAQRNYKSAEEIVEIEKLKKKEVKVEEIKIIVPSLRLDNIVSDLARTSRSKAAQIMNQERVFINGQNETKLSKQVKLNDVITIRGKGRTNKTRK